MGILICICDEKGVIEKYITDIHNILHNILPDDSDARYHLLNKIDWYGDTVFNYLQVDDLLSEIELLSLKFKENDENRLLKQIQELVKNVKIKQHQYLKFVGD